MIPIQKDYLVPRFVYGDSGLLYTLRQDTTRVPSRTFQLWAGGL